MDDDLNPYQSPRSEEILIADVAAQPAVLASKRVMVLWPILFLLNLVVPLLLGASLLENQGRIGVGCALILLLITGWYFCYRSPYWGKRLLAGSVLTGLAQLFPILHFIVGLVALELVAFVGLARFDIPSNGPEVIEISSEAGGFVITVLYAAAFVVIALVPGWLLSLVLPRRWFAEQTH